MNRRYSLLCLSILFSVGSCSVRPDQSSEVESIKSISKVHLFPLEDVELSDGFFKQARDLNIKALMEYDVDRLLQPFRKEAGLPNAGLGFTNWSGLDGHVGGHYLSAMAMNYASTKNEVFKQKLDYIIASLKACQDANTVNHPEWGVGYVGGVPNSKGIWSTLWQGDFTAYRSAWVPWYNVHKMYAGLRDAWSYTGNEDARIIFLKFCDWGIRITSALTDEQMQTMLDVEHGGMNEIFVDAYQMTGDLKYLNAAKRFSHHMLLNAMAVGNDNLDNKHANTQVPKAVGFQRISEFDNDDLYAKAGEFFWETVTTNRSLAFGGNSRREHFPSVAASGDFVNEAEGPETCNSYNMLKLTRDIFRSNSSVKYIDYYERTVYNHILSSQHPEHGGYVYFTPARPRHYRVYSKPNEAMWCCVGSGMENHSKYNEFIYTHAHDSLFLNLFIPSELNWKQKGVSIKQETKFPYEERTNLIISEGSGNFKLLIRYPSWVKAGALKITVNGGEISHTSHPSSFVTIERKWNKGDVVEIVLPMHMRLEQLPNVPSYQAFMYGPILLAAKTGTEDMTGLIADDSRWGHIANGKRLPIDKAPIIIEDHIDQLPEKFEPVEGMPLTFTAPQIKLVNPSDVVFEPFYTIHDERYIMYWMTLTNGQYASYKDSLKREEEKKIALQKRTIDFVAPGEQQPEIDHEIQKSNSNTGNRLDEFWRDARNEGYFSYNLRTDNQINLSLLVRYWGAEYGSRRFDIYIDDQKLITENNTDKWNQSEFKEVLYSIPNPLVKERTKINVKFQALPGSTAGAVYYIRLIKNDRFD